MGIFTRQITQLEVELVAEIPTGEYDSVGALALRTAPQAGIDGWTVEPWGDQTRATRYFVIKDYQGNLRSSLELWPTKTLAELEGGPADRCLVRGMWTDKVSDRLKAGARVGSSTLSMVTAMAAKVPGFPVYERFLNELATAISTEIPTARAVVGDNGKNKLRP